MNKLKVISVLLVTSLLLNFYFLVKEYSSYYPDLMADLPGTDTLYKENCPNDVERNRICSIRILEKRNDFALVRIHYHYIKGDEHSNRIVVKSNKGSHDNVVGTRGGFDLVEGDSTIDVPMGMYKRGPYSEDAPYISKYIVVKAQGLTKDRKKYTHPDIFEVYAKYDRPWFVIGETRSW